MLIQPIPATSFYQASFRGCHMYATTPHEAIAKLIARVQLLQLI